MAMAVCQWLESGGSGAYTVFADMAQLPCLSLLSPSSDFVSELHMEPFSLHPSALDCNNNPPESAIT